MVTQHAHIGRGALLKRSLDDGRNGVDTFVVQEDGL